MSIISASTLTNTALQYTADTTGTLVFKTGATPTTALTLNADQSATFAGTANFAAAGFTDLSYTGTLTGGTGIVNLGSGQFYKDASGNVGLGTTSPSSGGKLSIVSAVAQDCAQFTDNTNYTLKITSGGSTVALVTGATGSQLALGSNGSEKVRIDNSGNVGIGTSSPTSASGYTVLQLSNATNGGLINFAKGSTIAAQFYNNANNLILSTIQTGSTLTINPYSGTIFQNAGTEAMRIDSSGNLLVGQTSVGDSNSNSFSFGKNGWCNVNHVNGSGSGTGYIYFGYNGSSLGSITQNGTTAILYNTTSDYRLKSDVTPIQNALATVEALNPVNFNWVDGRNDDGFIAHELQEIIPNCVTGEKDAVDKDGNPKYQQMDNSGVIPFLVKAIKELKAEFDEYKATHP